MGIKVFELYSGIGGMHFALKASGIDADVLKAIDINTTANLVYRKNFPNHTLLEKNIESLGEDDFNGLDVDMILMSPPCQPHTRNGLKRDKSDRRSDSLSHIITLIPKLKTVKYILLENVKGFEVSTIRDELIEILKLSGYTFQEFLLTPTQFGIPNSRLRYYLLAKKKPLEFCFEVKDDIMAELPSLNGDVESIYNLTWKFKKLCKNDSCFPIGLILNENLDSPNYIPENILRKYGNLFDIITPESTRSCCFTKGYCHFVEGTGSVLSSMNAHNINEIFEQLKCHPKDSDESLQLLKSLDLRYFTPGEIAKLMSFPESLLFPNQLSNKQIYRLLGNSINVHVVAILIRVLVTQ